MIERIAEIEGIGLLHQANGKPYGCKKATLIYAENGRGKSTLASILRSVSNGNSTLISDNKTLDGTLKPKVVLHFGSGHAVTYQNGSWTEIRPEVVVFDADFVGRNVHSGGTVNTDHRKNLLEFALGEAAVTARQAEEKATTESRLASEQEQVIAGKLSGHHQGIGLIQFEKLPKIDGIDAKVADLQKRLSAASNVALIQARPTPKPVAEPGFNIDQFFDVLRLSLQNVHANAEELVNSHVLKIGGKNAESWLSQGRLLGNGNDCPFCDQDISKNELIKAYQTHFNHAYEELKTRVATLQSSVKKDASGTTIDAVTRNFDLAATQSNGWKDLVATEEIVFDSQMTKKALEDFLEFMLALAERKLVSPTTACGSPEEQLNANLLWQKVLAPIQTSNTQIKQAESAITAYKITLNSENITTLQAEIQKLQATKRRYDPIVVALFGELEVARKKTKAAEAEKKKARESLDAIMEKTLSNYQTSINKLLAKFGASFSIQNMNANFRGKSPRSEYGLLLRGKHVPLEGGPPSFTTALSEGDKRTLAFAFFVASTIQDTKLADRIVVVDDPMCSLDLNRKHHTRSVLKLIHQKAKQLIVFAHDPHFLRDMRDALVKENKATPISMFQLKNSANGYSDFGTIDIDKECESIYSYHHSLLSSFSAGNTAEPRLVAKAIRPMLEGYLHRRFPGILPRDQLFGLIVAQIRDSSPPNPIHHARNLVNSLNEINEYAGQFHHDTNPDADSATLTISELMVFVNSALDVVYRGSPPDKTH